MLISSGLGVVVVAPFLGAGVVCSMRFKRVVFLTTGLRTTGVVAVGFAGALLGVVALLGAVGFASTVGFVVGSTVFFTSVAGASGVLFSSIYLCVLIDCYFIINQVLSKVN
jgi:hypothetical protein